MKCVKVEISAAMQNAPHVCLYLFASAGYSEVPSLPSDACAFVHRLSARQRRTRYKWANGQTRILSSSNARWGLLRLAPINTNIICIMPCGYATWVGACKCTDSVSLRWNRDVGYAHYSTPHVAALALPAPSLFSTIK